MTGMSEYNNRVLEREWGTIEYAVCTSVKMPAKEFVEGLKIDEQIRLNALFEKMAAVGKIWNKQKFRHLEDAIYEFKSRQIRMACFQDGRAWILTHGFIKKGAKTPRKEIARAKSIRKEHLSKTR
jgi:phage-related protein